MADARLYATLDATPDWRRMLSNFHVADFRLEGRTWRTVEHCFQAAKIAIADPVAATSFALESGSALARGDGLAARKSRKMVVLTPEQLARWDAEKSGVMQAAMSARFLQHPALAAVLLATRDAELWHSAGRGQAPARVHELEAVREEVRREPAFNLNLRAVLSARGIDPDLTGAVVHTSLITDAEGRLLTARYTGGERPGARPAGRELLSEEAWACDLWNHDVRALCADTLAFLLNARPGRLELVGLRRDTRALRLLWRASFSPGWEPPAATEYHEELRWVSPEAIPEDLGWDPGLASWLEPAPLVPG